MSKKLLLADDSVTIQKVIQITFANEDYDLTIVGNGDEAFEKAKLNPPDLILADIIMPGKNGYELCSEIKKIPELAQAPVLLLVGSFEPFDEEKARSVGADSWIAKPFESQALIEKVQEMLENPPQPVQMPTTPPVPSLEEKEAQLEKIIPLETSASFEEPKEPAAAQPAAESEEETVSFDAEPETPAPAEEPAAFELEEPAAAEPVAESEEEFVSFDAEPEAPAAEEEPAAFEFEEPAAAEPAAESEEEIVSFDAEPEVPAPAEEPAAFEFEEPEAVQSSVEPEEPVFAAEADTTVVSSAAEELSPAEVKTDTLTGELPVEGGEEPVSSGAEEDEDEEILLLNEDDIVLEEEVPEEEAPEDDIFTLDSDLVPEPEAEETEEFFESLPESSFYMEAEEEDTGIVLHRPLGAVPLDDGIDEDSEEEPSMDTRVESEVTEEEESDQEFSFANLDDGLPEEEELSLEPEEEDSTEFSIAAEPEEKAQVPTYAQMEQKVHSLTDAQLHAIVEKVAGATIERMAKEVLEQVAWEVVPNLSENIIKEEIQKIKAAQ